MNSIALLAFRIAQSQFLQDVCLAGTSPFAENIPQIDAMKSMMAQAIAAGLPWEHQATFVMHANFFYAACNHGAQVHRHWENATKPKKRGRK